MSRIVVIGGGVVGLCVAHACASRGHRVIVVERDVPERDDGCSFANAGMVVPSHVVPLASPGMIGIALRHMWTRESPLHVSPRPSAELLDWGWKFWRACTRERVARAAPLLRELHFASRALYEQWAAQWGNPFGFVESGLLVLCRTGHGLAEEAHVAAFARGVGVPAEVLDPNGVASIEPGLRMSIVGGVFFPRDARLVPGRLVHALRTQVRRLGVDLRHGVEAVGFRVGRGRIAALQARDGAVEGDEFVLAAGVRSARLARTLGLALPMQSGKGYSLTLERAPVPMRTCAILSEARAAVTPMEAGMRFGGTMEITGIDERIDAARVRGLAKSIGDYFPDVTPQVLAPASVRSGLRPCSPDGLPYIGRFGGYANLSAATGHAMMGVSLAPVTGMLLAQVLSGERTSIAIDALSPDRYARRARVATKPEDAAPTSGSILQ